jgi:hypothetical protein
MSEHPQRDTSDLPSSRIPDFRSREKEAEFWDTHDVTDYLDELRPVRVRAAPQLSQGMTVRLDASDRETLGRIAAEMGVGPSTLVRIWIKERLRELPS